MIGRDKISQIRLFFDGMIGGFKTFSSGVVNIVNLILLLIVYLLGVGLTSLVAKIFNKHFLDIAHRTRSSRIKSYWKDKKQETKDYDNQY